MGVVDRVDSPRPKLAQDLLLEVEDLAVTFETGKGDVPAVRGASWEVGPRETLVVLGESGSGKTVSLHAAAGLLPQNARVRGNIRFRGREVTGLSPGALRRYRGQSYGMVFQDPLSSLNPCFPVGDQIAEVLRVHRNLSHQSAWRRAVEILELVRIREPARRAKQYPHELSGGMRQRVMISMAIALEPPLLLADEPTTALDTSVRASILETIQDLRDNMGMGVVLITHDIGVAAAVADRVAVMYAGAVVEYGDASQVLSDPAHPYTAALLGSVPRMEARGVPLVAIPGTPPTATTVPSGCSFHPRCRFERERCATEIPELRDVVAERHQFARCHWSEELRSDDQLGYWRPDDGRTADLAPIGHTGERSSAPLLRIDGLTKEFPLGSKRRGEILRAVDGVSLGLQRGETLGLVGESGSGKSTTAMMIAGLVPPTSGTISFRGQTISGLRRKEMRKLRRHIQVVFQDPFSSLDPRMTIEKIVAEPLWVHRVGRKEERRNRVGELMELVGLDPSHLNRHPHQLSGGQAQRVSIARALTLEPDLLILDEPVSALDLSIQAQVLNLLRRLQRELGLTYVFIGHDLAAVGYISDRIAVMKKGEIVELDTVDAIYDNPRHDYTSMLLQAMLDPQRDLGRMRSATGRSTRLPMNRHGEEEVV